MLLEHKENMSRVTVFTKEGEWDVDLEVHNNHPFLHFSNVNPTIKNIRDIIFRVSEFKYFLGAVGYPYVFGVVPKRNTKIVKFLKRIGLKELPETDEYHIVVLETGKDE